MRRPIARIVIVVALGITTGCGTSTPPATRADQAASPSPVPVAAEVVDVVCSPAGTRVSATRFAAQRDGVHLRVQNTSGKSGVYLNYNQDQRAGVSGGDPVDSGTVLILGAAPGRMELNCSYDTGSSQDAPVAIEVLDPAGAWHTGDLAALGCSSPQSSLIDWVYRPGDGKTADTALAALAAQFEQPVTWRHVREGYVDSARQTYVAMRNGKPWATASADRSSSGQTVSAYLGSLCSGTKTPHS
ncbi:hypothetical protein [Actinoplanes regularis]|uniref:hypothetical protein n=1 Tax=Actinoplanes regularis TaxID=52697 RepID=UPI000B79A213|nr:hypothetical protein [Actinoplanes regularis]